MKYFILEFCQAATDPSLKKGNEHIPVTMPLSTWTKSKYFDFISNSITLIGTESGKNIFFPKLH